VSAAPPWYKDAVLYELRVASFRDGDGDGIGDFQGLVEKLDYLQDLGVTALWLLPFYPSPGRDDGYDIADYTSVDPKYGTLRDFRGFLREAHRRGLRVVTELVLNHTSDQHPWFQRARRAPPGSRQRDFYVWSDSPDRYAAARIIFQDFESSNWSWDPVAGAYYWHRFYSHQPDLNFDNPDVRRALLRVLDHWLEMGVDGVRLDAVPYLFEREGTSCENLPETHAFLRELRAHVDAHYQDRMLLAEANQWPEDAVAYFGKADECQMAFHFPIMPRLYMAIHTEDRYPILDILAQTPAIPQTCQWAIFLRNHDELTLEMVTDEERDYLWSVYARDRKARINLGIRRRLAPLLGNGRRRIELMNALLLSLPGTPIVYYGDEIGMGDNVWLGDRNGVRTPMQWSPDRNAGFSSANPQRLVLPVVTDPEYHYEAVNVDTQQANPHSLLWWMKRVLGIRREHPAFGRGSIELLTPDNRRVLAFLRSTDQERILCVMNLSRFSQYVELDLRRFEGCVPVELFGQVEFPRIGERPYLLTLGPHAFHWFALSSRDERARAAGGVPTLAVAADWEALLAAPGSRELGAALARHLVAQRWFRSKTRAVAKVEPIDAVALGEQVDSPRLLFARVSYREGVPEVYALAAALRAPRTGEGDPIALLAPDASGARGSLVEVTGSPEVVDALLELVARRRRLRGERVELRGVPAHGGRALRLEAGLEPRPIGREQSNTTWALGAQLVAKLVRRLEPGPSVELEAAHQLDAHGGFASAPALAGHVEVHLPGEEPGTLALFQDFVANEGDAWALTCDEIGRFLEHVRASGPGHDELARAPERPAGGVFARPPGAAEAHGEAGAYLVRARQLGRLVGELHLALCDAPPGSAFAREPFTPFARRSLYESMRGRAARSLDLLRAGLGRLGPEQRAQAEVVLAARESILERLHELLELDAGQRIRCHGDLHLGQILWTGRDFAVIDFEGEPARSLGARRIKRSPLADVAGMLRSFHYAVTRVLAGQAQGSALRPEDRAALESHARGWLRAVSDAFLEAYLEAVGPARLLPEDRDQTGRLLSIHLLEKNLYELAYELDNRPDWVGIPLRGILDQLGEAGRA
jgi:maltose alpha-D-glucosyltransferase/alpha-amylase